VYTNKTLFVFLREELKSFVFRPGLYFVWKKQF